MKIINTLFISCLLFLVSCSTARNNQEDGLTQLAYFESGALSISRPVPELSILHTPTALSFMPVEYDNYWVKINTETSSLNLMQGEQVVKDFNFPGELAKGQYKVALKEQMPVWYANDDYFTSRGLDIPASFSSDRFLKGALGHKALFLDNGHIIHTSKYEDQNITGSIIASDLMDMIYPLISPDSLVLVE